MALAVRPVVAITPAERASLAACAEMLDLSVREVVRQTVQGVDDDDLAALAEIRDLLPALTLAVDRIEASLDRTLAMSEAHRREMEWRRSLEYREQAWQEVLNDPEIDWDAVDRLFGRGVAQGEVESAAA